MLLYELLKDLLKEMDLIDWELPLLLNHLVEMVEKVVQLLLELLQLLMLLELLLESLVKLVDLVEVPDFTLATEDER